MKIRNHYIKLQLKLFFRLCQKNKVSFLKLFNALRCDLAFFLKIKKGSPSPYILSLELWNECNTKCLFCRDQKGKIHDLNPRGTGYIEKGRMPSDMAIDIIRQLKNDILVAVLYTNGEPLLYPDLPKVIQCATDQHVATVIATNGLLLNEKNSRAILSAGIDLIKIQLSGFTQDIYSIQIRLGEVEQLKKNIRLLDSINKEGGYGTVILIDYILYNYNRHQLPMVREFCQELGLMLNVRPGNPLGGLENREEPVNREPLPLKVSCDYLWKVLQINFNGDILPCCEAAVWSQSKPYARYEINKTDLKALWRGEAARTMRSTMKHSGRSGTDMCRQCTRKGVCFKW